LHELFSAPLVITLTTTTMVVCSHKIQRLLLSLWLIGSLVSAVKLDSTSNEPLLLTKDYFSGAYNILGANQNSISYISLNFWIQSQTGVDKLIIAHKVITLSYNRNMILN
jgi:hypothetical protein